MTWEERRKKTAKAMEEAAKKKACPACGKKMALEVQMVNVGSKQLKCRRCGHVFVRPDAG